MGRPNIERIELELVWRNGQVTRVKGVDATGCGGEYADFSPGRTLGDLILEFVKHAAEDHDVHPPKPKCPIGASIGGVMYQCVLDDDGHADHKLEKA